jgi:uncharacterized protein
MTVDLFAHCGPWTRRDIGVEAAGLWEQLSPFGVEKVYAGRLEALWFENAHDANRLAESRPPSPSGVIHVPVLDPSFATWREELDRLQAKGPVPMVRLFPNYHSYILDSVDLLFETLAKRRIVAQVVARMDDPRRQHRLAQVPDVAPDTVLAAALRHPGARILLCGAMITGLKGLANQVASVRNLWADTSQVDGVGAVLGLMKTAWRDRLVFGSHAPLFYPEAAFGRVVLDLDDVDCEAVLRGNASGLLA